MVEISKLLFVILLIISWLAVAGITLVFFIATRLKRCKKCNGIVSPVDNYCSNCGTPVDKAEENDG